MRKLSKTMAAANFGQMKQGQYFQNGSYYNKFIMS